MSPSSSSHGPRGPHGPSSKPAARRDARTVRDAIAPADRALGSARIAERAAQAIVPRVAAGQLVGLYAPKGSEVETAALEARLQAAGFRVAYPRVVGGERVLAFHAATLASLEPAGPLGLREPLPTAPAIAPAAIAAFCIPGLAFDRAGGRIGWGLGHYDATLATAPAALRIGLAFDAQLVAAVPREPHDVALHLVITELGTHEVGA